MMTNSKCLICGSSFYCKPSHKQQGWGKYCSKECQYSAMRTGKRLRCNTCSKEIYKNKLEISRSKSGQFFCSKSCQTVWRNRLYSQDKHTNWKSGQSSYRKLLLRSNIQQICKRCGILDIRILAVHHRDKNRDNNKLSNLIWLCHNCHYLVHHDKRESIGFVVPVA